MIVMMCQVPVSIDYDVHLNAAKPVWIVSVMIRTKTMTLILKKKKEMPCKAGRALTIRTARDTCGYKRYIGPGPSCTRVGPAQLIK